MLTGTCKPRCAERAVAARESLMPVKRRRSKRQDAIEPAEWAYLLDEPFPNDEDGFVNWVLEFDYNDHATTLWRQYGEAAPVEFPSNLAGISSRSAGTPRHRDGDLGHIAALRRDRYGLPVSNR